MSLTWQEIPQSQTSFYHSTICLVQKKMEFLKKAKSQRKETNNELLKHAFITKGITQVRSKLFNYVKNHCNGEFVNVHTLNSRVPMKKSARKCGKPKQGENDEGIGNWLYVTSPDNLFKLNINADLKLLNYHPLIFNVDNDVYDSDTASES